MANLINRSKIDHNEDSCSVLSITVKLPSFVKWWYALLASLYVTHWTN